MIEQNYRFVKDQQVTHLNLQKLLFRDMNGMGRKHHPPCSEN